MADEPELRIFASAFVKQNRSVPEEWPVGASPYLVECARRLNEACDLIEKLASLSPPVPNKDNLNE